MNEFFKYFKGVFGGLKSLVIGMSVTGKYFIRPKEIITQQYPENRSGKGKGRKKKLEIFERFKGEVVMPHNEKNEHRCNACGICQISCPNGSITVIPVFEMVDGKKVRTLDKHIYNLAMCTFCGLCVKSCPSDAIVFANTFEHAVFDRADLIKVLNKEGSVITKETKE